MSSSTLASFKMARNRLINCETEMLDAEEEFRAKLHKWIPRVKIVDKCKSMPASVLQLKRADLH